jgi:two-component system sensor histidine kinase BaeS
MARGNVPLHRSLIVRLLAASVTIAVCAIVSTAWLTFRSTRQAINQEKGRGLSTSTDVYNTLVGYAATHTDWRGVGPLVDQMGLLAGRRITLTTPVRAPLADSSPGASLQSVTPSATVDALRLNAEMTGRPAGSIDLRAVGPYRLTPIESAKLAHQAASILPCLTIKGLTASIVTQPSGRPIVQVRRGEITGTAKACFAEAYLDVPVPSEREPLEQLTDATNRCLGRSGLVKQVSPTFTATLADAKTPVPPAQGDIDACVLQSHRAQLRSYVAPPALLFITANGPDPSSATLDLSRPNLIRIFWVTGLILAAAIAVTVLVGIRLVRPLHALTEAARNPDDQRARIPISTRDEIGNLARALNELTDRREQLEEQRKAMVSDVAHELRSPLTNIRSWLEGAQDGMVPLDPSLLDLLLGEAVLLQHVIDDLRDLAAADAGTLRLHPQPSYVNDLLDQVIEANRETANNVRVHLRRELTGDPEVDVDPDRLRQIVGNLVSNAVRHTPPFGTVTINSRRDGETLEISVADTGHGMTPEDLAHVFDRFWRADASRTRTTGGSGLGLSIVRQLTEAHGGTVTAVSKPGAGSTFTIRLPVVSPEGTGQGLTDP